MSLEVHLVERELEPAHARIDLDLPAPRHGRKRAGRRAGRARHQPILPGAERNLEAAGRKKNRQRLRTRRVRALVQVDDDRPRRSVHERAQRHGITAAGARYRSRHDLNPRRRWTAGIALVGLADLFLLDRHLGEPERGHAQEEAAEVLAVAIRDRIARLDGETRAACERRGQRERACDATTDRRERNSHSDHLLSSASTSSVVRTRPKGPWNESRVASWISGEKAAHPSSSSTTSYPRSAASRAVVSTQTFVTTPPTTSDETPNERNAWSRPVELNVPYVVLFTTSSPGFGSRVATMRAQRSARGGMAASPTAARLAALRSRKIGIRSVPSGS